MPSENEPATESLPSPPMAASSAALKMQKSRFSVIEGSSTLFQSEASLPYRSNRHSSAASLYASTLTPPGSRSQSPVGGRPMSRIATGSVFGGSNNNAMALDNMAGDSPGDPLNLIIHAFVPHIAVYVSEDTDLLLKEKGFESGLWELLRPFGERVQGKVTIRDGTGSSRTYEDYAVRFTRFGEHVEYPEPAGGAPKNVSEKTNGLTEKGGDASSGLSKKSGSLTDIEMVVKRHLTYAEESFFGNVHSPTATKQGLDVDVTSPYYSLFLRRLLSGIPVAPHESFAHPVACVIAISSRNPAPIDTLRRLYNETSSSDNRLPNWVDSEYLRYYVLVHDEEKDDITSSMSLFEQMKRNLGLHCHLLRIRGTQSAATDDDSIPLPRSEWMAAPEELAEILRHESVEDFEDPTRYIFETDAAAIRTFIREMVTQSIIPTMERRVSVWNEQVASRRRGVTGRFLGLTRRWGFGSMSTSSKSSTAASGSNYDFNLGFYRADAQEAIIRKLADYAFMLRDWKLAYSTYDLVRGDFSNDKAWKHHAAANEMAAIALLISPQNFSSKTRIEQIDSMLEQAFYSYQTRCTHPYGALRTLILCIELLRLRGGSCVDDAAKWGLRLLDARIVGAVGDALIKERIAVCYASKQGIGSQHWGARGRKSAMWSALGAESWVNQAKYIQAQRCLNEARNTYDAMNTNGVLGWDQASGFMLGIGQKLNEQMDLQAAEQGDTSANGDDEEEVDEESEVLGERGRRLSVLGVPGSTSAALESAPLSSEEQTVDSKGPADDFG